MAEPTARTRLDAATDITVAYLHAWPKARIIEPKEVTALFLEAFKAVTKADDVDSNWWHEFRQEFSGQK